MNKDDFILRILFLKKLKRNLTTLSKKRRYCRSEDDIVEVKPTFDFSVSSLLKTGVGRGGGEYMCRG
jgi:hypothetical protein